MSEKTFWVWDGKEIRTLGELLDAAVSVTTREEAQEFLAAYKAVNEHAAANIGYILGYLNPEERGRLYKLFEECSHPVFGSSFGRGDDPTAKEAFEAGLACGKAALEKDDE
jgi:hypothetical protein